MMLRESSKSAGIEVDLEAVRSGRSVHESIDAEKELLALTEAIVARDERATARAFRAVVESLNPAAAVDACAVVAAFNGFDIVADATGCRVSQHYGDDIENVQEALGIVGRST